MKLTIHPYFLEFIRPFALAHGTRTGTQLAFVKIEHQGIVGYGEASLPPYLPETFESVEKWIKSQDILLSKSIGLNPFENKESIPYSSSNPAASAALTSAVVHWYANSTNTQLSQYFEQNESKPLLAITITKNDFDDLDEKLELAKHFTHLKLKLTGQSDDLDFVQAIRKKTELPICVDINQGYENKETVIQLIDHLVPLHCVLVEQPLKAQDHEGHYWLKTRTETPIIADESIKLYEDLVQFHDAYDGVNIKLMKCGGLFQAQQMIDFLASSPEYIKLLGCMTESTLGVSTSAALASQFYMADLDAPYLIKNDPFDGFEISSQQISTSSGIRLKKGLIG